MNIVDSHVHLWDPQRLDYPWLADLPQLNQARLPEQLAAAAPRLSAAVVVQADCRPAQALDEVAWISSLALSPVRLPIAGIVAYAPLDQGADVDGFLQRLARYPRVVGVRRSVQNDEPGILLQPGYRAGMLAAARAGLTIDICVRPTQLATLLALLTDLQRARPGMRVVIDHLGKPDIAGGQLDPWRQHMTLLAAIPGVFCKLSGLVTEADWACWQEPQIVPFIHAALAAFGPERCMFGGDWPVVDLAGGYQRWYDCLRRALAIYTPDQQRAVWHGAANHFYRLL